MGTYWTNCGKKINARIIQKSPNVLNLSIENIELNRERLLRLKLAAAVLFLYAFAILVAGNGRTVLWLHGSFGIVLFIVGFSYTRIVKNGLFWKLLIHCLDILFTKQLISIAENLVLVKDFALQYSTNFIGGSTKNVLIPIKHIHDVVINEAFHNVRFFLYKFWTSIVN